jgi:hypothetical protein
MFRWLSRFLAGLSGRPGVRLVTWPTVNRLPETGTRRVPLPDYARNLDTMIRDARARGAGAVLLAPGNRSILTCGLSKQHSWYPYFKAQEQVAVHHRLPLVRAWEALGARAAEVEAGALLLDEMHPSALGQAVIAEATEAALLAASWPGVRLTGVRESFDPGLVGEDRFQAAAALPDSIQVHLLSLTDGKKVADPLLTPSGEPQTATVPPPASPPRPPR